MRFYAIYNSDRSWVTVAPDAMSAALNIEKQYGIPHETLSMGQSWEILEIETFVVEYKRPFPCHVPFFKHLTRER